MVMTAAGDWLSTPQQKREKASHIAEVQGNIHINTILAVAAKIVGCSLPGQTRLADKTHLERLMQAATLSTQIQQDRPLRATRRIRLRCCAVQPRTGTICIFSGRSVRVDSLVQIKILDMRWF